MLSAQHENPLRHEAGAGRGEVDPGSALNVRRARCSRATLNTLGPTLALIGLLMSAPAAAEPLRAALARAYAGNPTLNAERARQRADDEAVPQARALGRPRAGVTLAPGLSYEQETPSRRERREAVAEALAAAGSDPTARQAALLEARRATRAQVTSGPGLDIGLTANQTLFNGGLTAASVGSAESGVLAGRETLRGVEQDVLLAAATAYLDVVQAQANVALRRANITFLDEVVRQARKRYQEGETALTDQAQAESRRARGGADLAQAEANLVAARAAYRAAIGVEPGGLPSSYASEAPFQRTVERRLPARLEAAIAISQREHPAIRGAMHGIDVAVFAERIAASALLPSVTLQGSLTPSLGITGSGETNGSSTGAATGVALQVPIYDGGAAAAAVRQAKERTGQARLELETARDAVRAEVNQAWGAYQAAGAAVTASGTAVAANEIALAGVQREQLEGQRTVLEVLNAQAELLNARTALIQAQRDRSVATFQLLAAIGRLSATHIGITRQEYRPETHYRQVRDLWGGTRTPDGR